jgi:hypothetical protein
MIQGGPKDDLPGTQTRTLTAPPISQSARQRGTQKIGKRRGRAIPKPPILKVTTQDLKAIGLKTDQFTLSRAQNGDTANLTARQTKLIELVREKVQARMALPPELQRIQLRPPLPDGVQPEKSSKTLHIPTTLRM